MPRGAFIVIDGLDGSGKATQTDLLAKRLAERGIPSESIDFPRYNDNVFGALIGECLAGKRGDFLHLDPKIASTLYALDRLESAPQIEAWRAAGRLVLADRFVSSNQIHQGGKIADEAERTVFLAWLARMEHGVLGVPRPDAVIYLRVSPETTLALLSEKRETKNQALGEGEKDQVESDRAYVDRSYACAGWLAASEPGWHIIDCMDEGGMRAPEAIHEDVFRLVAQLAGLEKRSA